jgi:S-adenosylmethionine:tRNA ribosyltransferase-isomerase
MHPKNISSEDFSYILPNDRIAKYPLAERDQSKLLIYRMGNITENNYADLAANIPSNTMMIFNNSKVIEARIVFEKASGGQIEIFCLEPDKSNGSFSAALQQKGQAVWKCLIGGASKWKKGQFLEKMVLSANKEVRLRAAYRLKQSGNFLIEFNWTPAELTFAEILKITGLIPLPPYLKRAAEKSDANRYQTIYASFDGSVAAPTAGLHFTNRIFENLAAKNIKKEFLTLHVGAGTFKPMLNEFLLQHEMHEEHIEISGSTLLAIVNHLPEMLIPVGTTSMRVIESLFWLGVKTVLDPRIKKELLAVGQWDAYQLPGDSISVLQALNGLLTWMDVNQLDQLETKTQLLISPGYSFKITKALLTNFHQPRSTLLLLVAALIGDDWKKVYDYALENEFRFLSYGDGCLLYS